MTPAAVLNVLVQTKGVGAAQAQLRTLDRTARTTGAGMDIAGKRAGVASRAFGALKSTAGLAAGAAGVGGLIVGVRAMSEEYREAQKVTAQTNAVLKSTRGVANVSRKGVEDLSQAISLKAGIDDEAIQTGANLLLTFKNIRNEVGEGRDIFDQATRAAVDLSAAGFGSLSSASKQLGKALNDPVKGMTALGRAGVTFSAEQKKAIEALMATGRESDRVRAQQVILREVMSQVGGSAEAQATAADKFKVSLGNLGEVAGRAVIPWLDKLTVRATAFVNGMLEGTGAGGRFRDQMARIGEQIRPVLATMLEVVKAIGSFAAKNPGIAKVVASLAAVGLAIKGIKFASKISGLSAFLSAARTGASTFQSIWARAGTRAGGAAAKNSADELAARSPGALAAHTSRMKDALFSYGKIIGPALGAGIAAAALRELGNMLDNALGVSKQARSKANAFSPNNALDAIRNLLDPGAFLKKAGGGWIGARGEAGRDSVPVMLGRGEAVLNRHQQGPVESALRSTFGFGLDGLFAREQRPHYMATGGRADATTSRGRGGVSGDTDFLPAMRRALDAMSSATGVPIFVQSGRRTLAEQAALYSKYKGKRPVAEPTVNAPHVRGVAADITPGRERFGQVAGRYGLAFTVPQEPWHVALSGAGAVAGSTLSGEMQAKVSKLTYQGFVGAALPGAVRAGARPFLARIRAGAAAAGMAKGGWVSDAGGGVAPVGGMTRGGVLGRDQLANARTIVRVGKQMGATDKVLLAALEAGLVESDLRNVPRGHLDSLGVFQQRPSQGWGSREQVLNVQHAARSFFERAIPLVSRHRESGSLAQAVQRSAYPARYGQRRGQARELLRRITGKPQERKKVSRMGAFKPTARAGFGHTKAFERVEEARATKASSALTSFLDARANAVEAPYQLALLTPDGGDDAKAAQSGLKYAQRLVDSYAARVRQGTATAADLQGAITYRDTWRERAAPPATGDSSAGAASSVDLAALLRSIDDGIKEQNARAARIGATSGGVLARAIADVASGQIGGQVIRSAQTPMWAGSGARY